MKMLKIRLFTPVFIMVASLVVVACGGGGGGSVAGGGIGGTGITASGVITGFGSIKLNGLVLDTTNATRVVDGVPAADDSALAIGMVVTVKGTLSADGVNGTADQIEYDDDVQGPIQGPIVEVDQTKTFSVMGIQVSVNKISTVFDGNSAYGSLFIGELVEVSGFFDGAGTLHATRIEKKGDNEVEVKGTVTGFGPASTFKLAVVNGAIQYTVDYTAIVIQPALGDLIEVKGTLAGTTITATEIESEDEGFDDVDKASIEGIVTDFIPLANFKVAGQEVNATGANFEPGALEFSLADGIEVEVEGPIVNGVLQAIKVEARGGDIEIGAVVKLVAQDTGGATRAITLDLFPGSLTVLVDSQTLLRDDTGVADPLTLDDIVEMVDFLEVEAYLDDNNDLIATEIRRDDPDDDFLQGPVDSCDGGLGTVTILGLEFDLIDGTTEYEDENDEDDDESIVDTAFKFCSRQQTGGYLVNVVDINNAGLAHDGIADEAELED